MIKVELYIESSREKPGWTKVTFNSPPVARCTEDEVKATKDVLALIRKHFKEKGSFEVNES